MIAPFVLSYSNILIFHTDLCKNQPDNLRLASNIEISQFVGRHRYKLIMGMRVLQARSNEFNRIHLLLALTTEGARFYKDDLHYSCSWS